MIIDRYATDNSNILSFNYLLLFIRSCLAGEKSMPTEKTALKVSTGGSASIFNIFCVLLNLFLFYLTFPQYFM